MTGNQVPAGNEAIALIGHCMIANRRVSELVDKSHPATQMRSRSRSGRDRRAGGGALAP